MQYAPHGTGARSKLSGNLYGYFRNGIRQNTQNLYKIFINNINVYIVDIPNAIIYNLIIVPDSTVQYYLDWSINMDTEELEEYYSALLAPGGEINEEEESLPAVENLEDTLYEIYDDVAGAYESYSSMVNDMMNRYRAAHKGLSTLDDVPLEKIDNPMLRELYAGYINFYDFLEHLAEIGIGDGGEC